MFLFISCPVCLHLPSIYVVDSPQFQQNSQTLPRQMNEEFQQLNIGEEHQAGQQMSSVPSSGPSTSQSIEPSEIDRPSTHLRAQSVQPLPSVGHGAQPVETPSTSNREPFEPVSPSIGHGAQRRRNVPKISFKRPFTWPNKTKKYSVVRRAPRTSMAIRTQRRQLESYRSRDVFADPQGSVLV